MSSMLSVFVDSASAICRESKSFLLAGIVSSYVSFLHILSVVMLIVLNIPTATFCHWYMVES